LFAMYIHLHIYYNIITNTHTNNVKYD